MLSRAKSYFHYLIGFQFRNEDKHVQTAYLDTYNRNFKHGSTVSTYNIHEKVFIQFANSFVIKYPLIISTGKFNKDRKFEAFFKKNNSNKSLLITYLFYISRVIDIIEDYSKYNLSSEGIIECINQILHHYNHLIDEFQNYKFPDYKVPVYLPDVQPLYHTLTREFYSQKSQPWSSFEPAYIPGKGRRGYFETEYDNRGIRYYTHYVDF